MLRWRLLIGLSIAVVISGLCWLDVAIYEYIATPESPGLPGVALFPLLLLLVAFGCREMLNLAHRNDVYPIQWVTYTGCFLIATSGWVSFIIQRLLPYNMGGLRTEEQVIQMAARQHLWQQLENLTPANWAFTMVAAALILVFLAEMWRFKKPGGVNIRIAYTVFCMVYIGLLITFMVMLRLSYGLLPLISFILVVKMGDVGAYAIGRLFGRNKMAPGLSPGKTVEGGLGALVFSCFFSWLFFAWIAPVFMGKTCFTTFNWSWVLYGITLGVLGMTGDLAESLLKRDAGTKDADTIMPGFGGVLDLLDSLLLAAPVGYAFWALQFVTLPK